MKDGVGEVMRHLRMICLLYGRLKQAVPDTCAILRKRAKDALHDFLKSVVLLNWHPASTTDVWDEKRKKKASDGESVSDNHCEGRVEAYSFW